MNEVEIILEHKENGKWVKVVKLFGERKRGDAAFMIPYKYLNHFLGLNTVDSRFTMKNGKRLDYWKTENSLGGFDFRARFV